MRTQSSQIIQFVHEDQVAIFYFLFGFLFLHLPRILRSQSAITSIDVVSAALHFEL